MADNDAFIRSINLFVEQSKENMEEVVITTGIKILNRLITMSPVGQPQIWKVNQTATAYNTAVAEHNASLRNNPENLTKSGRLRRGLKVNDSMDLVAGKEYVGGRFRGNWQVSFDKQSEGVIGRDKNNDPGGSVTLAEGVAVIEQFKVGVQHSIYFVNNLPYAYPLEFGHSSQAPNGMIRVTAQEFGQMVEESAQEIKK